MRPGGLASRARPALPGCLLALLLLAGCRHCDPTGSEFHDRDLKVQEMCQRVAQLKSSPTSSADTANPAPSAAAAEAHQPAPAEHTAARPDSTQPVAHWHQPTPSSLADAIELLAPVPRK